MTNWCDTCNGSGFTGWLWWAKSCADCDGKGIAKPPTGETRLQKVARQLRRCTGVTVTGSVGVDPDDVAKIAADYLKLSRNDASRPVKSGSAGSHSPESGISACTVAWQSGRDLPPSNPLTTLPIILALALAASGICHAQEPQEPAASPTTESAPLDRLADVAANIRL